MNQIDMHTISASGSANNLNKVLEEKSPKGQSNRASSKNVHGLFNDTINQKRDSFPPYDAMGSEKNNSARQSEVEKKWIDNKKGKVSPLNLDESKSDNGYQNVFENIDHSRQGNEDENRFLTKKAAGEEKEKPENGGSSN